MNDRHLVAGEQRLQNYLSQLADVLGHADRKERLVGYLSKLGRLFPSKRARGGFPPRAEWGRQRL